MNTKQHTPAVRRLEGELPNLFDDFFSLSRFPFFPSTYQGSNFPALNVWENENTVRVEAEVPGLAMEDLDITLTGRVLTIEGERRAETPTDSTAHRREFRYGRFRRALTLPFEIQGEEVKANMKDGLLYVELPKAESHRPKRIEVKVDRD